HPVHQATHQLLGWDVEQVLDLDTRHPQPRRRHQHQPPQPVLLLDGEAGGDEATQREPDQVDVAGQPQLIEQLDVVQHEVVRVLEPLQVARLAVARMVGDQHPELLDPRRRERPAVEGAGPVEEHEGRRRGLAGRQDHRRRATHVVLQALERHRRGGDDGVGGHATTSVADIADVADVAELVPALSERAALPRSRGMTSSANSVVFFTTFQFGMSPMVRLRVSRLAPDSSIQPPMASATFSGVPATMRLIATRSSQLAVPCTSGAWIRLRNSGTVTYPGGLRYPGAFRRFFWQKISVWG